MRLDGLAAAFAALASGGLGPAGERVAAAMSAHPALVGFPGSIDTELMAAAPGRRGEDRRGGRIAIGTPDGRGLALKVLDGNGRAIDPAGVLCARELLGLPRHAELRALAQPRSATRAERSSGASRPSSTRASGSSRPRSAASSSAGGSAELAPLVTRIPTSRP